MQHRLLERLKQSIVFAKQLASKTCRYTFCHTGPSITSAHCCLGIIFSDCSLALVYQGVLCGLTAHGTSAVTDQQDC